MKTRSARRYPNTRAGRLSEAETETRRLAYAIKDPHSPAVDFALCAHQMAQLIAGPCWLVPIPNSQGSTRANGLLAAHIASFVPGAQVAHALRRTRPVESQCARHKANLGPTAVADHHIVATGKYLGMRQVYFVDNVRTSGNTLAAAHAALGTGAGLVFASLDHAATTEQPTLF